MDVLGEPLNPNKRLKEEFVSNLTGSSMLEIAALSAVIPALVVLRQWISSGSLSGHYPRKVGTKNDDNVTACGKDWRACTTALTMDFLCVILPVLLLCTVLADGASICAIFLILLLLFCISAKRDRYPTICVKEDSHHVSSLRMNILSYRVSVVVMSCLCILAVDFKIFPRRYAKTETFGTSWMDLGVGSFVLANSLVSRQARNGMSVTWKDAMKSICPLVVLGFGRLISTAGVDYQVHVGEYGVHWNFFFTLAAVSILTSMINVHPRYCGIFGSLILIGYQVCLLNGLSDYLISNERTSDVIGQNKEGIFSVFGYWGLHLIGVHLGYRVFFSNESPTRTGTFQRARTTVWILSVLLWLLTIIFDNYVERVSRRTCNLAYVTLVLAENFEVIAIYMISGQKPLVIEQAFNQNMLGSFLLANVLTGIVNFCVDTLSCSWFTALAILVGYMFVLSAAVGFAFFFGVRFKFW